MFVSNQTQQTDDDKPYVYGDGRIDPSQVVVARFSPADLDELRKRFTNFPFTTLAGELRNAIYDAILDEYCDPITAGTNPDIRPRLNPPDILHISHEIRKETFPLFIGKMVWHMQLFDEDDMFKIREWLSGAITPKGVHGLRKVKVFLKSPAPRGWVSVPMNPPVAGQGMPVPDYPTLPFVIDFRKRGSTVFCGTMEPNLEEFVARVLAAIEKVMKDVRELGVEGKLTVDNVTDAFLNILHSFDHGH
ncbi:uncharacterized protein K452DRAFT_311280 [Aplosporella prunicola CBS 121167]|uniref:Uncharacterized protein n=1 Tax=Aplosporella prunicola CBS 121167 TaxID=1176127 RepID=A0A6A6B762_9PEZI|nr:uncharacterized protein K452DRAFT_311280 [Aplosporella prunicola CBS 121167]KAF2138817.1 hypothetical protein K452DRAFT_311280 [Aplosporella prunicola CBS 121167]